MRSFRVMSVAGAGLWARHFDEAMQAAGDGLDRVVSDTSPCSYCCATPVWFVLGAVEFLSESRMSLNHAKLLRRMVVR